MPPTYPDSVNHGLIAPQAGHPRRKGLTRPRPETGRESPDLLVATVFAAGPWVAIVGALTLAELLPSGLVLLCLSLGVTALVIRSAR